MWFKRFSSRQKLVIICFLIYFVYGITKQATYTTKATRQTADLSSLIRSETNITKLKQLNDQINAQINNVNSDDQNRHDIKPDLGVDRQHMPVPAGHAQINDMQKIMQQQHNAEDSLAKMENAVEKVKEEQSRRRSVAVTKRLQPKSVQVYLRSRAEHKQRRASFRAHYQLWQSEQSLNASLWLPGHYVFLIEANATLPLRDEINEHGDIYLIDKLPAYNATVVPMAKRLSDEIEFSLYVEQFKLAAMAGKSLPNVKTFDKFTKSPQAVNIFLRDTDIVNYDTIRQAFNVLAAQENKENNMVAFGGLKRDFQRHIPYTTWKIGLRADLADKYWAAVLTELSDSTFKTLTLEKRFVRLTGTARLKVPINGIVSNRIVEAVVTFPYENPEYKPFRSQIHSWVIDHIPPNKFRPELPPMYLDNNFNWTVGLHYAPNCSNNQVLSMVKTSRSNVRLRRLVRLSYQLDMRRQPQQPFPLLRFLLGRSSEENPELDGKIAEEMEKYDDIIIGDFTDSYDNLPLKTLTGYTYLAEKCPSTVKWVMFHDDDALINNERAVRFFNEGHAQPMNCFGFLGQHQRPHRWAKYNVTMEQWETGHYYPQFCSGPCNGISREAALKIYESARTTNTCGFRLEDVLFMGIIREKAHLAVPHFEKGICQHFDQNKERYISSKLRFYLRANRKNEDEIKKLLGEFYIAPARRRPPPGQAAIKKP